MKVAIIGAGFSGLSAGYYLAKRGIRVTIFEKEDGPGGLARGFKKIGWDWPLEQHYHHLFESDSEIINFAQEIGVKIDFFRGRTSILTQKGINSLDSATALLNLPDLDFTAKLRTGITLGYLKLTPFWKPLERITTKTFITKTMGKKPWQLLWQPLFKGKFGKFANRIPASWFWARIKKRSVFLGYPQGGFDALARSAADKIIEFKGRILYKTEVISLVKAKNKFKLTYKINGKQHIGIFGQVVSTPSPIEKSKLKSLGAITLVLWLSRQFLPDKTYWLNIGLPGFPFLNIIEHTKLIPRKNYNGEHLVYVGKYLPADHKYFSLSKEKLLDQYDKSLALICPDYKKSLIGFDVFGTPYAQPIIPLNYSKIIPAIKTNIDGLYLATMEQVYPWDRGTNYAVELGKKVANAIIHGK